MKQGLALKATHFDSRWVGEHGIGRFAAEMRKRIGFAGEIQFPIPPSHPLDVLIMTWHMGRRRHSLVYSPGYNAPILGLGRYVLTVHDLNHVDIPGHHPLKRLYYHMVLKRACRRAARVLTVSEFSRRRIVEWAGIPSEQVVNVGNGVGSAFRADGSLYNPGFPYFLLVSNRKRHKNEERMLRAFAQASIDPSIKMLVTGESTRTLDNLIADLVLADRVVFVGRLSDAELAECYRGAVGLLFVSLYEGFGLPIVEAMSCGCPVITSNVTAMPEVAGNAALLVDPLAADDIAEAIARVAENRGGTAVKLRRHGLKRAKAFGWGRVSGRVFEQLAELQ